MSGGQQPRSPKQPALNSYVNKATKSKFDRLKREARDDLRIFSSIAGQRKCCIQPLYSVRVGKRQGKFQHDSAIACKNRQSCPWCTTPKLAADRTTIRAKGIHAIDLGGFALYGVFTLPKRHAKDLAYSYKVLKEQVSRFRRKVKDIEVRYGITDSVRTYEETYSDVTYWHPHVNYVWFIREPMQDDVALAFQDEVLTAWLSSAADGGIRGVKLVAQKFNTFRTTDSIKTLSDYVTKHSFFDEGIPSPASDGNYYRLKPWQILNLARTGDVYWIGVWHQFEKAMKGQRRVYYYRNKLNPQ